MISIYLVRHGQTAWNKEEIFRGRSDIPLDGIGIKQAELLGEYLRDIDISAIYSSPLSRAIQTAQFISKYHNLDVKPLNGLIDMSFGNWEGHSHMEIQKIDPEIYRKWIESPHMVKLPGGEGLDDVRSRSMATLNEITNLHSEGNIVLVSHRVINKVLICGVLGIDNSHFWQIRQDTASINLILYRNGRYILTLMNETCHLKRIKEERLDTDF